MYHVRSNESRNVFAAFHPFIGHCTVNKCAERGGFDWRETLSKKAADKPCEHIAGSRFCERRISASDDLTGFFVRHQCVSALHQNNTTEFVDSIIHGFEAAFV